MTSPALPRRRPPGRYDEPSRVGQRALAVVLGTLFVLFLLAIGNALYQRLDDPVRERVIDFAVLSESRVRIDLEVAKDAGTPAYCVLRARGADGAEVGREVVTVDADGSDGRVVRRDYEIATRERAVTGESAGCDDEPIPPPPSGP